MKKIQITIILLLTTISLVAQNKSANELLNEFGFTTDNVLSCIDLSSATYSFKANSVTTTEQEANHTTSENSKVYTYDATKKQGEKFTLISTNDDTPRKKDFKHFDKEKNSVKDNKMQKLKEEDFFVKSNDETTAVIGFNIPAEKINSKTAFMAHCTGYIYIDKKSDHITKIQIKSDEAFNLKIFHVTTMTIDINLEYNNEHKQYYVSREKTMMKVLILGLITDFNIEENYSDFKFY